MTTFDRCDASTYIDQNVLGRNLERRNFTSQCDFLEWWQVKWLKESSQNDGSEISGIIANSFYQMLPDDEIFAISHQPRELIRECTLMTEYNEPCRLFRNGVHKFISPSDGVCYNFNYGDAPNVSVSLVGELYGLQLELDVDSVNSMQGGLTPSLGVKIILHERDKLPLTSTAGIALPTNTLTKLALKNVKVERQPEPYTSKCLSEWPEQVLATLSNKSIKYQENLCQSFCLDDFVRNLCNCSMSVLIDYDRKISPQCNMMDPEIGPCIGQLRTPGQLDALGSSCTYCRPACDETIYETDASHTQWPSKYFWPHLAADYNITYKGQAIQANGLADKIAFLSGESDESLYYARITDKLEELIRESFLKVQIFYGSRSSRIVREIPKYNTGSLISSIGGALSLYLGVSIISMFEVVEFVARGVYKMFGVSMIRPIK